MSVEVSQTTVGGGYFITRPAVRSPERSPGVLPSRLISLSSCICVFAPAEWALPWGGVPDPERVSNAGEFGIAEVDLPEVARYVEDGMDRGDLGWPCVWHSVEAALEFATRFCDPACDWIILGAALEGRQVSPLLESSEPDPGMGTPGVLEVLSKRRALEPGGLTLGWEMLGYDAGGTFHSWLCHGLEIDVVYTYAIRPNAHGLIASRADAEIVAAHCQKAEVGTEPGFWAPWMLAQYSRG